jgi:hypothetical protein
MEPPRLLGGDLVDHGTRHALRPQINRSRRRRFPVQQSLPTKSQQHAFRLPIQGSIRRDPALLILSMMKPRVVALQFIEQKSLASLIRE